MCQCPVAVTDAERSILLSWEGLSLVQSFRGFSPWHFSPIAFGPVGRPLDMIENEVEQSTHFMAAGSQEQGKGAGWPWWPASPHGNPAPPSHWLPSLPLWVSGPAPTKLMMYF